MTTTVACSRCGAMFVRYGAPAAIWPFVCGWCRILGRAV